MTRRSVSTKPNAEVKDNKYRLVAEMNFTRKVLFIRRIMTHKEYEKGAWKT
jgi:mRNA interferase HigB